MIVAVVNVAVTVVLTVAVKLHVGEVTEQVFVGPLTVNAVRVEPKAGVATRFVTVPELMVAEAGQVVPLQLKVPEPVPIIEEVKV